MTTDDYLTTHGEGRGGEGREGSTCAAASIMLKR